MTVKNKPLSHKLLRKMNDYWRAANYLSVGQFNLFKNKYSQDMPEIRNWKWSNSK